VSLAAVEALDERTRTMPEVLLELARLRDENDGLRARLERLEALVAMLAGEP
jgi:hypothetical protein